jgi:diadenylate cyclase
MSDLVSVSDVCKVIQRSEMIIKISDSIKRAFTELGKEGNIMNMRYRELNRGVEKIETELLRDYAVIPAKRARILISNLNFDSLFELESIARFVFEKQLEESTCPRGYRFLSHLTLSEKEISQIVSSLKNLNKIIKAETIDFEDILKNRANSIYDEIQNLREQILSGKVVS